MLENELRWLLSASLGALGFRHSIARFFSPAFTFLMIGKCQPRGFGWFSLSRSALASELESKKLGKEQNPRCSQTDKILMFDLEQAISRWRKRMIADGIKSATILDELETHLRDEVDEQMRAGMEPADAFRKATQRLGQGTLLKTEFAKLRRHSGSSLLWLFRIACFITAPFMLATSAWVLLDSESVAPPQLLVSPLMCARALYLASLPFWYRFLPNPYRRGVQIALKAMNLFVASFPVLALLGALGVIHLPLSDTIAM